MESPKPARAPDPAATEDTRDTGDAESRLPTARIRLLLRQLSRTKQGRPLYRFGLQLYLVGITIALVLLGVFLWLGYRLALKLPEAVPPIVVVFPLGLATGWVVKLLAMPFVLDGRKMMSKSAETLLREDRRPPVLYLRPFADDRESSLNETEQVVREATRGLGPLVAVGDPDEILPSLGGARTYLADEAWRTEVRRLMGTAQLTILAIGSTPGLLWELTQAVEIGRPSQLVLYVPRTEDRERRYEEFRRQADPILRCPLPPLENAACFIGFDADWKPELMAPPRWRRWSRLFVKESEYLENFTDIQLSLEPLLRRQGKGRLAHGSTIAVEIAWVLLGLAGAGFLIFIMWTWLTEM